MSECIWKFTADTPKRVGNRLIISSFIYVWIGSIQDATDNKYNHLVSGQLIVSITFLLNRFMLVM